ncbi:MAG TPA: hypothetical protein VJU82_05960 [Acidobacteriaceae bacterium]|nr:hypothetical protein [Acidobacteriaceae bacterium]
MYCRVCCFLILLPLAAFAQNSTAPATMPGMDHSNPLAVINGKDHPEQIPDAIAYRLYFTTVGELPNPTDARQKRQRAYLGQIGGLSKNDSDALVRIVDDFKVKFTAMVAAYNAEVAAAVQAGSALPDTGTFLAERDQLVQDTRDRLKVALSANAMVNLDAHVQFEKQHMAITSQAVSQ